MRKREIMKRCRMIAADRLRQDRTGEENEWSDGERRE